MNKDISYATTFWITNISERDVSLSDLNISIRAMTSVNLLDAHHYPHLTLEILQKSEQMGSLLKKKDKLKHRQVSPIIEKPKYIPIHLEAFIPSRQHSDLEIKYNTYDELNIVNDEEILSNITDIPATKSTK